MLRRSLTALLTAALVLAPAAMAFAQEGGTDTTTDATTDEVAEPGLGALADLVDAITSALGLDGAVEGEEVELTDEQRDAWALLLDEVLEVVKTESLVARAGAELLAEDTGEEGEELTALDEGDDEESDDEASEHGQIVRTVAQCAPRGKGMKGLFDSIANHGAIVSAAAQGGTVTLAVPVLTGEGTSAALTDEVATVEHELTTLAAAEALCADLETIATAKALSAELASDEEGNGTDERAARAAARDQAKADREAERAEREAERDAAKAERAEAKAERDATRAERADARGKGKSDG